MSCYATSKPPSLDLVRSSLVILISLMDLVHPHVNIDSINEYESSALLGFMYW